MKDKIKQRILELEDLNKSYLKEKEKLESLKNTVLDGLKRIDSSVSSNIAVLEELNSVLKFECCKDGPCVKKEE